MPPSAVTEWLLRRLTLLLTVSGCNGLDDRTVTLLNGEPCSERRQCESAHCELAAVGGGEEPRKICCSISCADGSACAPSGTSCVLCPSGRCEGQCEGEDCELDQHPATGFQTSGAPTTSRLTDVASVAVNVDAGKTGSMTGSNAVPSAQTSAAEAGNEGNVAPSALSEDEDTTEFAPSEHSTTALMQTSSTPAPSTTTSQTVSPDEVPKCGEPLLINGDFESEMQAWTEETSYVGLSQRVHPMVVPGDHESVSQFEAMAQSGSFFAYVGGVPDDDERGHHSGIVQTIVIPPESAALWLRGYVWVTTEDTLDDEYDFGFVQLERTPEDENYRQFDFWTNLDVSEGWVEFEALLEDLGDLPGRELRFLLGAITDETGTTRFWFDSLRLEAICE